LPSLKQAKWKWLIPPNWATHPEAGNSSNVGSTVFLSPIVGLFCLLNLACTPIDSPLVGPEQPQTLHQVILKRTDRKGQLLWQVQAAEVERVDAQILRLRQLRGTFYQNREAVYVFQSSQGQVDQQATFIRLQGPIVVENVRDRSTLHSQNIQWHPQSGQLIAQSGVALHHPHFQLRGQRLQASTRTHDAQISGTTTLKLPGRGWQLQAHQLTWLPHQGTIQAHSPASEMVVLKSTAGHSPGAIPWQQAQAQWMELDLQSRQLSLHDSVQLDFIQPQIQLNSPQLIMDWVGQEWQSPQGIQIQSQGITGTAKQGSFDRSRILRLQNQVRIQGLPHQAHLRAQQLTWNLTTQDLKAQGEVVYHQPVPWMKLTGKNASANLRQQTLEVQGGEAVAEILP